MRWFSFWPHRELVVGMVGFVTTRRDVSMEGPGGNSTVASVVVNFS